MKSPSFAWLIVTLVIVLLSGCSTSAPTNNVDRSYLQDPARLMARAQQQSPRNAALTRLEAADLYARQGRTARALQILGQLQTRHLDDAQRVRWALLYSGIGRARDRVDDVLTATAILDQNLVMSSDQRRALEERRRWARSKRPSADELYWDPTASQQRSFASASGTISHIAVFLPASGPLSEVASALRTAIKTQHDVSGSAARLTFLDSAQRPLPELYQEAQSRGAQVVIGPLDKKKISMMERQESVPLPTLALNYGRNPNNRARGLLQYGLSAEDEARQVARQAFRDNLRRMSVMVPDNRWGARVGQAFTDTWQDLGGQIARSVSYDPQRAVTDTLKQVLTITNEKAELTQLDGLFLLAVPQYARQVMPTLKFYRAGNLPVYATSHLNDSQANVRQNADLDGAIFLDIPWQIPEAAVGGVEALPYVSSYARLKDSHAGPLFRLTAMGVDAYAIASRMPAFFNKAGMQGATGQLRLAKDGRIYRQLPWAVFAGGRAVPIIGNGITPLD